MQLILNYTLMLIIIADSVFWYPHSEIRMLWPKKIQFYQSKIFWVGRNFKQLFKDGLEVNENGWNWNFWNMQEWRLPLFVGGVAHSF